MLKHPGYRAVLEGSVEIGLTELALYGLAFAGGGNLAYLRWFQKRTYSHRMLTRRAIAAEEYYRGRLVEAWLFAARGHA